MRAGEHVARGAERTRRALAHVLHRALN